MTEVDTAVTRRDRWCALNFWRCRHAHCLVTGAGWLGLSLLALVGAGLGHSVVGGHERGVFVVVLVIGFIFEAAWQITRGTNAMTRRAWAPEGLDAEKADPTCRAD